MCAGNDRRWSICVDIGEHLKRLDGSLHRFAEMCGVNYSTVRSHLSGERVPKDDATVERYLHVLELYANDRLYYGRDTYWWIKDVRTILGNGDGR